MTLHMCSHDRSLLLSLSLSLYAMSANLLPVRSLGRARPYCTVSARRKKLMADHAREEMVYGQTLMYTLYGPRPVSRVHQPSR